MDSEFLTIRLSSEDARRMRRLREATGLSRTEIVRRALRSYGEQGVEGGEKGLFGLGSGKFGRYGDKRRQSADIKRIARSRVDAKRTGR